MGSGQTCLVLNKTGGKTACLATAQVHMWFELSEAFELVCKKDRLTFRKASASKSQIRLDHTGSDRASADRRRLHVCSRPDHSAGVSWRLPGPAVTDAAEREEQAPFSALEERLSNQICNWTHHGIPNYRSGGGRRGEGGLRRGSRYITMFTLSLVSVARPARLSVSVLGILTGD